MTYYQRAYSRPHTAAITVSGGDPVGTCHLCSVCLRLRRAMIDVCPPSALWSAPPAVSGWSARRPGALPVTR